jgi:L-threonylcarbamoyladenylate synthase
VSEPKRVSLAYLGTGDALSLIEVLAQAALVCFPTDTLYGVGGVLRPSVGERVYAVKGRAADKPLQVVFPTVEALVGSVPLEGALLEAIRRLLPGGSTLLLPYPEGFEYPPPGVVEAHGGAGRGRAVETLGVRVPRWPEPARVLGALTFPLLASSANPSGAPPAASLEEVDAEILHACDLLLDAGPVAGTPSTVGDMTAFADRGAWRVLRAGAVSEEEVRQMLARKRPDLPR